MEYSASGITVTDSIIAGNTTGIQNSTPNLVNAEYNYWGASDGPSNLGGSGDRDQGDEWWTVSEGRPTDFPTTIRENARSVHTC